MQPMPTIWWEGRLGGGVGCGGGCGADLLRAMTIVRGGGGQSASSRCDWESSPSRAHRVGKLRGTAAAA